MPVCSERFEIVLEAGVKVGFICVTWRRADAFVVFGHIFLSRNLYNLNKQWMNVIQSEKKSSPLQPSCPSYSTQLLFRWHLCSVCMLLDITLFERVE